MKTKFESNMSLGLANSSKNAPEVTRRDENKTPQKLRNSSARAPVMTGQGKCCRRDMTGIQL